MSAPGKAGAIQPVAAAAWPIAARAQQTGKLPTIGFLGAGSAATWKPWLAAFVQRLHELGWVEGRTITVEHHWAEGRGERFEEITAEQGPPRRSTLTCLRHCLLAPTR
jgi:hypothetical protein